MFISEFKSLLYRPLIMLDQRKYSGHMKIKTCFPIFVIFFSLVPNLGNSDEKMLTKGTLPNLRKLSTNIRDN